MPSPLPKDRKNWHLGSFNTLSPASVFLGELRKGGRKRPIPPDSFKPLETPRTPKDLRELATDALEAYREFAEDPSATPEFTCDTCTQASICCLAFDLYNTDGDCLMEK